MNKRVVKSYQDITVTEVIQSDGAYTVSRAYLVRVATQPKALNRFADFEAAIIYFEELVLQRLSRIATAALRN
jgi:hypothetical protein